MQEEETKVKSVVKERAPNYQYMALYQRMAAGGGGCWTGVEVLLCMYDIQSL